MSYAYVGSPYSHPEPLIREQRFINVSYYVMAKLKAKQWVYSPIVHCHQIAQIWDMPKDAAFWEEYNFTMLRGAHTFEILRLDGWEQSLGLIGERKEAERLGIPVVLV